MEDAGQIDYEHELITVDEDGTRIRRRDRRAVREGHKGRTVLPGSTFWND